MAVIPVWLRAGVVTLIAEGGFEGPDEGAVPGEELGFSVNVGCLQLVQGGEIFKETSAAGDEVLIDAGFRVEALDGGDIRLPLNDVE
jgi:hypothetical protein